VDTPQQAAADLAATIRARALYQGPKRFAKSEAAVSAGGWDALRDEALGCTKCGLCDSRTHVVFGEGSETAELMFVGEAPGRDEDAQGRPFVGRSGQLLTKMIEGMGLKREDVFIANVLKCRPPDNRDPAAEEVEQCRPYLLRQIDHIQPKVICALGRHALRALTGYNGAISKVRGRPMNFQDRIVIPTFHPAYLLRNPPAKADAWDDLKGILKLLGRPVPKRKKSHG